jgi:hypothetical protein
MKHNILEKRYRKTLYNLEFIINDKYLCQCYEMEVDSYSLRIYDMSKDNEELYSNWFDETLSWVTGNEEYYTLEDIEDIVEEAYRIIDNYMITNLGA